VHITLGRDFLLQNQITIDFHEECFRKGEKQDKTRYGFSCPRGENVGENETNGGQTDHTTDAPLLGIHSTQPSPRTQPDSQLQRIPLTSRQKRELKKHTLKIIEFGKTQMLSIITTTYESAISDKAYKSITARGYKTLQLPAISTYIAAGTKAETRVLLEFKIDGDVFERPFWVIPAGPFPVLLGVDFLRENGVVIDLGKNCFRKGEKENYRMYEFSYMRKIAEITLYGNGVKFLPF
jgi:hypothetical protein